MIQKRYIGIDIGGTKIAAALVDDRGKILARGKLPTPAQATGQKIFKTTLHLLKDILNKTSLTPKHIKGIGIGVPGIVANDNESILITPNINLSGFALARNLKKVFPVPVAINNDVNLGILGEQWLGAGRRTKNVVGLFPGTGIGGGIIVDGKLFTGSFGAAAEIGHMIMQLDGPLCSCGNHGCLEALASRWAIERDIRQAVKEGEKSLITELADGKLNRIKSKMINKALNKKDPLVTGILHNVAVILGKACISIKHIFNPEMIVLGGGVMEACGKFLLPIIGKTVAADPFFSAKIDSCKIVVSQLGDDAVILGAVALVKNPAKPC